MLHDFEEINLIMDALWSQSEPVIEPIDDPSCEIDFWDWAEILGIVDEFEPEWEIDHA